MIKQMIEVVNRCEDLQQLERVRLSLIGKGGLLTVLSREIGRMLKDD